MSVREKRLRETLRNAKRLKIGSDSKIILMSDCHRGQGNNADDFMKNQSLFFGALEYYYRNGFVYIELGDGDELWENRRLSPIIEVHSDAFWLMSELYREGRFHMLYGNHDIVKRRRSFADKNCGNYYCSEWRGGKPEQRGNAPLFPGITIEEGILLEHRDLSREILLVHGHQGSLLNDTLWPVARFLVRYVWKPLETVGFISPTGAGRSHREKETIEIGMDNFAKKEKILLIAGHTHRPVFPAPGEGMYFNDGSCVHPRCITGIEIENNALTLIKWSVRVAASENLYVGRTVLAGPTGIEEFFVKR